MAQIQEIQSWVTYGRVSGNRLSLELPDELDSQEAQIIIIPQKKSNYTEKEGWKEDFMSISQWDIVENNIRMESWRIIEC